MLWRFCEHLAFIILVFDDSSVNSAIGSLCIYSLISFVFVWIYCCVILRVNSSTTGVNYFSLGGDSSGSLMNMIELKLFKDIHDLEKGFGIVYSEEEWSKAATSTVYDPDRSHSKNVNTLVFVVQYNDYDSNSFVAKKLIQAGTSGRISGKGRRINTVSAQKALNLAQSKGYGSICDALLNSGMKLNSSSYQTRNINFNAYDNDEEEDNGTVVKILFLGQGGCGKSTVYKQFKLLLAVTENQRELSTLNRKSSVKAVHSYIMDRIIHNVELIQFENGVTHDVGVPDNGYQLMFEDLDVNGQTAVHYFQEKIASCKEFSRFEGKDDALVGHIRTLWSNDKFRQVFESEVCLNWCDCFARQYQCQN